MVFKKSLKSGLLPDCPPHPNIWQQGIWKKMFSGPELNSEFEVRQICPHSPCNESSSAPRLLVGVWDQLHKDGGAGGGLGQSLEETGAPPSPHGGPSGKHVLSA